MAARKTSTAPTRIWKFSARPVGDGGTEIREILFQARRYYNDIVAIERARYERFVAIRRRHAPELAALEDEWLRLDDAVADIYRDVKRSRTEHWQKNDGEKRRLLTDEARATETALKAEQKRVAATAREHRAAFSALLVPGREEFKRRTTERAGDAGPRIKSTVNAAVQREMLDEPAWSDVWKEIARSDDDAHAATLRARESCGLSTGTYLQVEESVQRAKKDSSPRPPRFRRFDGAGKLAVQGKSATPSEIESGGTNAIRIEPAPPDPNRRTGKNGMMIVHLDQSVPRGERRKIAFTAMLHRAPPADAVVKWGSLLVRRVGDRFVYEFQLTLEHPSFAEPKRPAGSRLAEHVRIGWARVDGGVRVAQYPGSEVVIPDGILATSEYAMKVESAADQHFDFAKRFLRRWMRGGPHRLTAWHLMRSDRARAMLRNACKAYADWALADVGGEHEIWKLWRADRLSRGEDLYARPSIVRGWLSDKDAQIVAAVWCYIWARKDAHLCQLAADLKRRAVNRRDAFFRAEAIRIATEFADVTVDSYSIAALKELPSLTLPGDRPRDQAQHTAQAAAPGRFREILREVMGLRCTPCERSGDAKKPVAARERKGSTERVDAGEDVAPSPDAE